MSNVNLHEASRQWATRPADERFWSVREAYDRANEDRRRSAEGKCASSSLRVVPRDGDIILKGDHVEARLNNWSFGQLCSRADAPRDYITRLPAGLAAECLNEGLKAAENTRTSVLVTDRDGVGGGLLEARAILSGKYERVWDSLFLELFLRLEERYGWRTPPARPAGGHPGERTRIATADDVLRGGGAGGGLSIKVGDVIAPAGVYRGDRDLFVFLVDDNHVIEAGGERLARGFFFWNSEVGARSFGAKTFLYRSVCGNHIVWGAESVKELRFPHVGQHTLHRANRVLVDGVRGYLESGASAEAAKVAAAQQFVLGTTKEEVVDFLSEKRSLLIPAKTAAAAYDVVEQHPEDGSPRSAWGIAQGLTRLSQAAANAGERALLDAKAGKVLEFAF